LAWETFLSGFEGVLWDIALALLIGGALLVILSFVLNIENITEAFSLGDHDVSGTDVHGDIGGHDVSGTDVHGDISGHDVSGTDVNGDIGGHDITDHGDLGEHDIADHGEITTEDATDTVSNATSHHEHGVRDITDITRSSAPLFLLMSTYFLIFGILGVSTLNIPSTSTAIRIIRIIAIIVVPYLLAYVFSMVWKKISATTSILVPKGIQLVGEVAEVYVTVDSKGGLIVVNLGKDHGFTKLHAKSYSPFDTFKRGERVRIVAIKERTYLVDKV